MNPQRNLRFVEFAQRSLVNYGIVAAQPLSQGRYEVTALLTSLVSIFVWTKEEYFAGRENALRVIWPELDVQIRVMNRVVPVAARRSPTYPHFLVNLRHGIAHGNIDLGNHDEVQEITIWNTYGATRWCANLPWAVLEQVARNTVFDLNAAAITSFRDEGLFRSERDLPCYECSCEFNWIGVAPPRICPYCGMSPVWRETVLLSAERIDRWSILRSSPAYCFEDEKVLER